MTVVALTGGISAGKTTVTDVLTAHGIRVIDADLLARQAVEPHSPGLAAVRAEFGDAVLQQDGSLNREALGAIIFESPEKRTALNAIVHPEVKRLSELAFAEAATIDPDTPIVYAIPLLAETGRAGDFDAVVVIDAPRAQRIDRLMRHRGLTIKEATARVDAQVSDETRQSIADCLLDASVSPEQTRLAAETLAHELLRLWPNRLAELPSQL